MFKNIGESKIKANLVHIQRATLIAFTIAMCIALGNTLDKFNSLVGTVTAAPVVFIIPCLAHYNLCDLKLWQKIVDILLIGFGFFVLFFCSGFTLYTWHD